MHVVQVQLSEKLYDIARERAATAGYDSVDEYVVEVLEQDQGNDSDNFDHLFTPEVVAKLKVSLAEADAGEVFTLEEANRRLDAQRDEWLTNQRA